MFLCSLTRSLSSARMKISTEVKLLLVLRGSDGEQRRSPGSLPCFWVCGLSHCVPGMRAARVHKSLYQRCIRSVTGVILRGKERPSTRRTDLLKQVRGFSLLGSVRFCVSFVRENQANRPAVSFCKLSKSAMRWCDTERRILGIARREAFWAVLHLLGFAISRLLCVSIGTARGREVNLGRMRVWQRENPASFFHF